MKKKLAIGISILFALVVAPGLSFSQFKDKPLYESGMVRARASLDPPPQARDESFWNVENDIKLYHYSDGAGQNVLVVHGGPGYPIRRPYAGLKPLATNYKFIYYDQRGCGKSTRPIDRFSSPNYYQNLMTLNRTLGLGAQLADIERIRRILGDEKLILLGHSFGAFLASLYAAEFPEKIKALILVAPADLLVMPAEDGGLFGELQRLLPENMKQDYGGFLKRYFDYGSIFSKSEADLKALNAEFGKYYAAAAATKKLSMPGDEGIEENGGWMVHAMFFSMGMRHDYRPALKNVKAPVLVIHGENDVQPEKASRAYADAFPNSRFVVIKNAGHFSFHEQPEEFAAVAGRFLKELN